jgi:hypothetical protein
MSPCRSEPGDVGKIHRRRITPTCRSSLCHEPLAITDALGQVPPPERCKASAAARGETVSSGARLELRGRRAIARVSLAKLSRSVTAGMQNGARASPQVSALLPACALRSLRAPGSSGQSSGETLRLTSHRIPALGRCSLFERVSWPNEVLRGWSRGGRPGRFQRENLRVAVHIPPDSMDTTTVMLNRPRGADTPTHSLTDAHTDALTHTHAHTQ